MRVFVKGILTVVLVAVLSSGCVTPHRAKTDDSLKQNQFGREGVEYYQVKVTIPF